MTSPLGRLTDAPPPHYQDRLANVILAEKPNIVVETGLETGFGAEYILKALDDNEKGYLYSIDPVQHPKYAANPITHRRFTFIQAKSQEALLPLFRSIGPFDFFIHDSDHGYECQTFEFEAAWRMVRPGGIIASDDVYWEIPPHHAWEKFLKRHGMLGKAIIIGNAQYIRKP